VSACLRWCLCIVPERSCGDGILITSPHSNIITCSDWCPQAICGEFLPDSWVRSILKLAAQIAIIHISECVFIVICDQKQGFKPYHSRYCNSRSESSRGIGQQVGVWVQIQPVICWYLSVFLFIDNGVYSVDSPKMIGNFPEALSFNRVFLKLNQLSPFIEPGWHCSEDGFGVNCLGMNSARVGKIQLFPADALGFWF